MAILNGIISKLTGSTGNLVFKRIGDRTIVCEKPHIVSNPRTAKQMRQRTKWGNIVAMYKGIRPLINYGFENRPHNLTDYNMFMKVNAQQMPVYLTKQMIAAGACIAAPYQLTQGSLPAIVTSGTGQNITTDIALGSDGITANTTVAQFSRTVVSNNADYKYGDQISYFIIKQKVNDETQVPYCQFQSCKVVLDASNDEKLWDVVLRNGFSAQDGCLGHAGNDGDSVFCWVHSRKSYGKILVSSQILVNANSALAEYTGELAYNLAASSYGDMKDAFLSPEDVATTVTETPSQGGGNSGGGNDSL
jgi:hypothetical protein